MALVMKQATATRTWHLGQPPPLSPARVLPVLTCASSCMCVFCLHLGSLWICPSFFRMCVTEKCRHQSVSSKSPHPPVHPVLFILIAPGAQTWLIGWLLYLSHPSHIPRVVNQRLISPRSATSTLASFTTLLTNLIYPLSRPTDR